MEEVRDGAGEATPRFHRLIACFLAITFRRVLARKQTHFGVQVHHLPVTYSTPFFEV